MPRDEVSGEGDGGWPGVARPASWMLRAPAAKDAVLTPDPSGPGAAGIGETEPEPVTSPPAAAPRLGPAVGPERARRGRAGGRGFPPPMPGGRQADQGSLSLWQSSDRLWGSVPWLRPARAPRADQREAAGRGDPPAAVRPRPAWVSPPPAAGEPPAEGRPRPARVPVPPAASNGARAGDTMLLEPELLEPGRPARWRPARWWPARWRPGAGRGGGRTAAIVIPAIVLVAVAVLALAMLTGHGPKLGQYTANQAPAAAPAPLAQVGISVYPGQQRRGVFQTINRIVASGKTIVTIGSQTSDGLDRQQFFVSADGGATWRLAPVREPGGGQPPAGYPAVRLAGGPAGWAAVGPQAIWTSPDGLSWTLAATHGITPQLPGDQVWVLNGTAQGFVAAGVTDAAGGGTQAVIWTSRDGLTWQRRTAAQLRLGGPGEIVQSISYATSQGTATVISGTVTHGSASYSGTWLSTNGGSTWTRVTTPAGHGAQTWITGLGFDGSGLIAVRPGRSVTGASDGVVYFSPDGRTWRYASTITGSGAWNPSLVKGSHFGFVVAGTSATGQIVAFTSTGTGTAWQPTAPLGDAATESVAGATVGQSGAVVAIGYTAGSKSSQQPVFVEAAPSGSVRPVSLDAIPGAIVPELAVNGLAADSGQQVAVGSADGYPAVWRKASSGSWALASTQTQVSAYPGLRALTGVTHGSAGWLAVGAPGPVIMTSADGTTWQPATGPGTITDDLSGVAAVAAAAGPAGYVIVGKLVGQGGACVADVWWSPNLTSWTRAVDVNDVNGSSQVLAVAAGTHGFVSAGSHNGKPAVWTSADGRSWTTAILPLPAGASGAVLQQIAIDGNRVVALGQETTGTATVPFAELSINGGVSWRQVPFQPPGPATAFTALTAGSGGFTAAGQAGEPGQRQVVIWTSASGTAWTQRQISGLTGTQASGSYQITALAPSGAGVAGIGVVATQASQEAITVTLPVR